MDGTLGPFRDEIANPVGGRGMLCRGMGMGNDDAQDGLQNIRFTHDGSADGMVSAAERAGIRLFFFYGAKKKKT